MFSTTNELRLSRSHFSMRVAALLSSVLALGTVACSSGFEEAPGDEQIDAGGDAPDDGSTVARIEVTPGTASVIERRSVQLTAKAFDAADVEIEGVQFTFASSDAALATVDAEGLVKGLRPGEVTITAKAGAESAKATITVTEASIASLEVEPAETEVAVDGTISLVVKAKDADGFELLGRAISFTSEDESTAVVDEEGKVSGVAPGETKIRAKAGAFEEAVEVRVVHRFQKIFAGTYHNCGLTSLGRAWCWGSNYSGALGSGDNSEKHQHSPVRLAVDPGIAFQTLALGEDFGCGLTTDEALWCWGENYDHQLGRDRATLRSSATPLLLDDRSYKTISAMGYGVCGLDDGGFAHCWGHSSNNTFSLGDPSVTSDSATPVAVSAPVGKAGPVAFAELRHGRYHSCGLTKDGDLYCWGSNWSGQLGDGTDAPSARPVEPLAGTSVTSVALGIDFTCAVTDLQRTYCWGANKYEQVEEDGWITSPLPAQRFDEAVFVPASLALGQDHGCALDADGRAWCWGRNHNGQLGRDTNGETAGRDEVEGDLRFTQLVSGEDHACGLAKDGKVHCWGNNYYGQLGNDSDDDFVARPVPVTGQ